MAQIIEYPLPPQMWPNTTSVPSVWIKGVYDEEPPESSVVTVTTKINWPIERVDAMRPEEV